MTSGMNNRDDTRMAKYLKKPLTRRQLITGIAALSTASIAASTYAFAIETRRLKVETLHLKLADFPGRMSAVQISDLHMDRIEGLMANVLNTVNSLDADFIFITGDLVEKGSDLPICLDWLGALKARQGILFVPGNWEHWTGTWEKGLAAKLEKIGVQTLDNSGETIPWGQGRFHLVGVDDAYYGYAQPKMAFATQPPDACTIALSHAPVVVNRLDKFRCDLVLSGHTHGGQIRLPFIGAPFTPPGSGPYQQGLYRIGDKILYVNRGIGTSVIPARVLCSPEITHLHIEGT